MGGPGTTTAVPDDVFRSAVTPWTATNGWQIGARRQAGTVDGYYRYKKDDTLDLSVTLWVWKASFTRGD
ncbi:hypothetical protein E4U37_000826 [Claviceps purpurea]|nr:hypothetical protein E4U37_000826 [Claviceps purpurea]